MGAEGGCQVSDVPAVLEALDEDEAYLHAILSDESGLDQAEFLWHAPDHEDGCFRAWAFQWRWWRCKEPLQVDQCVAMDQLVLTDRGHVPIQDVVVGMRVLTHRGRWRKVTSVWDKGEQEVVIVQGQGSPRLSVTPDHPLYARRSRRGSVSRDGHKGKILEDAEWIAPQDWEWNDGSGRMNANWGVPHVIEALVPPDPMKRSYYAGTANLVEDVLTPEFMWLFGEWLSDGATFIGDTHARTTWNVCHDKAEEVISRLDKVGLNWNVHRTDQVSQIAVNSRPLAQWLRTHGGHRAENKFIAPWIFGLDVELRQAVLDGLRWGDNYARSASRDEYSTSSESLAYDLKLLALSLGVGPALNVSAPRDGVIDGRTITSKFDKWNIGLQRLDEQKRARWHLDDHLAWGPVNKITDGGVRRVFDLEVEEDHSFVVNGVIVHNCARSVGKSLSIKVRGFAFPFLHPGNEMVVTAPELVHLEPIVSLIEEQCRNTRLSSELMVQGRSSVTHRPFQMNFVNGARIIGRIPQRDGKGIKGIHPLILELDEAQDYPEQGWTELVETLKRGHAGATWRAHGVTRGVRDKFYEFTQDSPDNEWKVHRFAAMWRPTWTDQERTEKMKQYGSRDDPDYRRNVLGLHGDATNPMFVLTRLMKIVDDDPASSYNQDEYFKAIVKTETLALMRQSVEDAMDYPPTHREYGAKAIYWCGMDVGFTIDPSEILTFVEFRERGTEQSKLKLLSRVNLQRMGTSDQARAILHTIDCYRPRSFAMDKTGLGLPLFQLIQDWSNEQSAIRYVLDVIKGYNFSEKITVGFDESIEVDELRGDAERDAGIRRTVLEYASDTLRTIVDQERIQLPWDSDLLKQFQGSTWTSARGAQDQYGRRMYSKGNDHILDAARMAILGWKQFTIEEVLKAPKDDGPVLDLFGY